MNYEKRDTMGIYKENLSGPGPHLMGADTLIGNDVYNHKDDKLGDIKEIMLDVTNGQVSYAVLSYGTFLGLGEKLFAVPWSALTLDTENKRFVLSIEKDNLSDAPGFDKKNWPNMADEKWSKDINNFYASAKTGKFPG
ncbi:photosystem reaction center subunit H [Aliidiomarina shirensis]|uniref:Photosystem reaction center subunit H n=1 Tax=Aliidiomarina shirensis TaxID=1048642 RepID=A0A432WQG1_9GAMM|nr:PRC-barrel domain-containing protein [Aliidiomarina shirensis]RUO36015.1 photosystem reaction center subunit H [Aliidiomarina shirensis]